ncbi:MAG: zinc ribbon domain-containing protein [Dictyoglomus sp.]|nr:zinc ribbon domain-containing protein [Dictyoglomus sp.]MCX7942864.1 zinc ribbon domain-containing protein [Dictyoglomaceae bacterium]MDW8189092.1 zinc ribbon domain-containing protein [Dictyoglomus sp.]
MPIYEYKCKDCGNIFEKLTYKEEEIECPNCGGKNIKKLISLFASIGSEKGICSSCSSRNCSSCR